MVAASFGQVGVAEREEAVQGFSIELGRESRQLLSLGIRQEPDRHPVDPTTEVVDAARLPIALVSSPLIPLPAVEKVGLGVGVAAGVGHPHVSRAQACPASRRSCVATSSIYRVRTRRRRWVAVSAQSRPIFEQPLARCASRGSAPTRRTSMSDLRDELRAIASKPATDLSVAVLRAQITSRRRRRQSIGVALSAVALISASTIALRATTDRPTSIAVGGSTGSLTTSIPVASTPPISAPTGRFGILRSDGIGPVRVGMTIDEAKQLDGEDGTVSLLAPCPSLTYHDAGAVVTMTASHGAIDAISISGGSARTELGVGVGSSVADLTRAYGSLAVHAQGSSVNGTPVPPSTRYFYYPSDPAISTTAMAFSVDTGVVGSIRLGLRQAVVADNPC